MITIAGQYIQDLEKFRNERREPGPERDEELADIIHEYHERAVRREDTTKLSIQWYSDGSATYLGDNTNEIQVRTPDTPRKRAGTDGPKIFRKPTAIAY